jgi:lipopolysaccharide assembly protein A
MIKPLRLIVAFACLALGVIVGALNPQPAVLDLGFTRATGALGVIVLVSLLIGVLAGGLALAASVVLPLRQRLRRAESDARNARAPTTPPSNGGA